MLVETRWQRVEVIDSLWSNSTLLRDGALNKPTKSGSTQPLSRRSFNCGRWIFSGDFTSKWAPLSQEEMVRRRTLLKPAMSRKSSRAQLPTRSSFMLGESYWPTICLPYFRGAWSSTTSRFGQRGNVFPSSHTDEYNRRHLSCGRRGGKIEMISDTWNKEYHSKECQRRAC